LFILYYYLPFLDGSKKKHCTRFVFNNNRPQIEHITKKKIQNAKKKLSQSARGPQINQQRSPNIFGIF
jgi:recombinational DNA repair protein RecT